MPSYSPCIRIGFDDDLRAALELGLEDEAQELLTAALSSTRSTTAYLELQAGAGGIECDLRTEQLCKMYHRWGNAEALDYCVLKIRNGWPWLRHENGVHRMLTWSGGKRQTTCTLVRVYPEIEKRQIEVHERDLEWQTYRSGGKGGQNVNKVETAARVKHIPTGLVAQCQATRSQAENKELALATLKAKIVASQHKDKERGDTPMSFGHQVRNYWLAPEHRIKETRIEWQSNRTSRLLSGDMDELLTALAIQLGP